MTDLVGRLRVLAGGQFFSAPARGGLLRSRIGELAMRYFALSSQKATALAAATLRLSTPWAMGIRTV